MATLLAEARGVIKQHRPGGAILGNSGDPRTALPPEFWQSIDADMLESYICTWANNDRLHDWATFWHQAAADLQPALHSGKQIQALSFLGHTPYGVREDAFFCYASARLAGFVWNGGLPLSDPDAAPLYRIRLGKPRAGELVSGPVHHRVFERGLVVLNADPQQPQGVQIGPLLPTTRLLDLFGTKRAAHWRPYDPAGYELDSAITRSGAASIRTRLLSATQIGGAYQAVQVHQAQATPLVVSGWSRADSVSGSVDSGYSIAVNLTYVDGTGLSDQIAAFSVGTHDWEQRTVTITPDKPVDSLVVYALFGFRTGSAWFADVSLTVQGATRQLLANGRFDETEYARSLVDLGASGGLLEVPPYSGRVYLFAAGADDELTQTAPKLTIATSPPLGDVKFLVDGFPYWTHRGFWSTEYVLGAQFGAFSVVLDGPGNHTIELVDDPAHELTTTDGYASDNVLGTDMDPAAPLQHSNGRTYGFAQWDGGLGSSRTIQVNVAADTTITARFDIL